MPKSPILLTAAFFVTLSFFKNAAVGKMERNGIRLKNCIKKECLIAPAAALLAFFFTKTKGKNAAAGKKGKKRHSVKELYKKRMPELQKLGMRS